MNAIAALGGQQGVGGAASAASNEVTALRSQISDKDRLIETMEQVNPELLSLILHNSTCTVSLTI